MEGVNKCSRVLRSHLSIVGVRSVTQSNFRTENPCILRAWVGNLVAWELYIPTLYDLVCSNVPCPQYYVMYQTNCVSWSLTKQHVSWGDITFLLTFAITLYKSSYLRIWKVAEASKRVSKCDVIYITGAFRKTHTTFKALDIVINNAGILDDGRWELEIAINVVSRRNWNM
jgi:hypothetical protein